MRILGIHLIRSYVSFDASFSSVDGCDAAAIGGGERDRLTVHPASAKISVHFFSEKNLISSQKGSAFSNDD